MIMTHEKGIMHVKDDVIDDSEQITNKLDVETEWGKHEDLHTAHADNPDAATGSIDKEYILQVEKSQNTSAWCHLAAQHSRT